MFEKFVISLLSLLLFFSVNAQEKYARTDGNAAIVRTTRYYKYSDPWHYDSEGYIDLGKQFAEALYQLNH